MNTPRTKALGIALLAISLAACSSNNIKDDDFSEPAELQRIEAAVELKKNWSVSVGKGVGKSHLRLKPVYKMGAVYAAALNGVVKKLDAKTGKTLWQKSSDDRISGAIGVDSDRVFYGTSDGYVVALDAATGAEQWRVEVKSEVLAAPRSNGRRVVVHAHNGTIMGLDHDTGELIWENETQDPRLTQYGNSEPLLVESLAIVGLDSGKLMALDSETGMLRWEQRLAIAQGRSDLERIVDIDGSPVFDSGRIYSVSYQGRVAVLDASTGRVMWRKDASSVVSMAEGFGNIYISESDGKFSAYKVNDGNLLWQIEDFAWRKLSAPATIGAYVAVADFEGYIHLVSQLDGTVSGRERISGSGVRADLVAFNDFLLAYSNDGKLVSYRLSE